MIEKHVQTILSSIIILLVSWIGFTTLDTSKQMATVSANITNLTSNLDKLDTRVTRLENGK